MAFTICAAIEFRLFDALCSHLLHNLGRNALRAERKQSQVEIAVVDAAAGVEWAFRRPGGRPVVPTGGTRTLRGSRSQSLVLSAEQQKISSSYSHKCEKKKRRECNEVVQVGDGRPQGSNVFQGDDLLRLSREAQLKNPKQLGFRVLTAIIETRMVSRE